MNRNIDPKNVLDVINKYLLELEDLLAMSYSDGAEKKGELYARIEGFIRSAYLDSDVRLKNLYSPYSTSQSTYEQKQKAYIDSLNYMKRNLISLKEEIEISMEFNISQENTILEIRELNNDLIILIEACEKDIDKDASVSYINHVKEYNRILNELKGLNSKFKTFKSIDVELEASGLMSLPPFEQAKLNEIISDSKKLIHRIQKIIGKEFEEDNAIKKLENIFSSFHSFVHQLKKRRKGREPLIVNDEYDVQYLLSALLEMFFKDVRSEDTTPIVAGAHRKIDFLLKLEQIGIEVKMINENLTTKKLGEQLHDDIAAYKTHPDCKTLVFFIYDPDGRIHNPKGFEDDIANNSTDEFKILVYISPKQR